MTTEHPQGVSAPGFSTGAELLMAEMSKVEKPHLCQGIRPVKQVRASSQEKS